MRTLLVAGLYLLGSSSLAIASILPKPGVEDPRLQTVEYDAQEVVTLRVALGYALTLEFSPDERIENVAVGNSVAWQITPNKSADHLFIKPVQAQGTTNMTVITDARSYNFELVPLAGPEPDLPFMIRILYPLASTLPDVAPLLGTSYYRFSGARSLHPVDMGDDGRVTSILWSPGVAIPAVYILDGEGREVLVNGAIRNGRFVIDQVANQFVFRLGDQEERATRHVSVVHKK